MDISYILIDWIVYNPD